VELPKINLEILRTVPPAQKVSLLGLVLGFIVLAFYNNYGILFESWSDKDSKIDALQADIGKLDADIQATNIKVKHLDELIAANTQLEAELAKKREKLPQEEEASTLLKQVTDLGVKLGLDIKLWKPGTSTLHPSKLYVKQPVNVEVVGGYHTAGLFFDRINKMPRIMSINDLKFGSPKVDQERVLLQTVFELVAYVAPPEPKPEPKPVPKPALSGK
jgi:type IV pilus assembly protein PilO